MADAPKRPGRPPRPEPAEPSGYRITAAQRRAIHIAMGFTDRRSMQAVIDDAVNAYLRQLRDAIPDYARAVHDAEQHLAGRPGNVTPLHDR
jgi:hypothetical protein